MKHIPELQDFECPSCGAIRSFDEMDWGCFCCGYQEGDDFDEDFDEDYDFDEDDEMYYPDEGDDIPDIEEIIGDPSEDPEKNPLVKNGR